MKKKSVNIDGEIIKFSSTGITFENTSEATQAFLNREILPRVLLPNGKTCADCSNGDLMDCKNQITSKAAVCRFYPRMFLEINNMT